MPILASVEVGAKLGVYPNPSNGMLTLTGLDEEVSSVEIFDGAGRKIRLVKVSAGENIDLSDLKGGHYWLRPLNGSAWIGLQIR
jgi:hypothetical protein